jgi:hypothetical protein
VKTINIMRTVKLEFDVYKFSELQEMAQNIAKENLADELDCDVDDVTQDDLDGYEYYWDGQIHKYESNEIEVTTTTAKLIKTVDVIDPDGDAPIVQISIYKEKAGGFFGVDSSYIEVEEPVYSPFGNGEVNIEE